MFTKKEAQAIGQDIQEAVQAVAAKHGVRIEYRGGVIGQDRLTVKVEVKPAEAIDLSKKYAWMKLLPIGTQFESKSGTMTVFEHDMKKPKFNLVCKDANGKILLFNNDQVRENLIRRGIIKDDEPKDPFTATGS